MVPIIDYELRACNKTLRHEALQLFARLDSAIQAWARADRLTLRD
jgi:hypothetical protein